MSTTALRCHGSVPRAASSAAGERQVVLAGNPNVGKSVFFGYLTGVYADVSNYPGTTIEISRGRRKEEEIVDTPGIYGVSSFNDEEAVARDIILGAGKVLNVVAATHLERDLFLTRQLIDMGKPVVVALNFMDEAERAGLEIDVDCLSRRLGVEVVPTAAVNGRGLEQVGPALERARCGCPDSTIAARLAAAAGSGSPAERLLVLEGDAATAARLGTEPGGEREAVYRFRRQTVNDIVAAVTRTEKNKYRFREALGRAAVNPLTGIPLMAVVLYGLYKAIGVVVAGDIVGLTEETIMQGIYEPWIRSVVSAVIQPGSAAGQILIGEFGVLTMTVTYLAGLLLPLVVGFYLALSVLEDSGYLPRLATLVDRLMTGLGLNGRAVIPIILGFGCVQLGTITTRLLATKREKTIAASLLNFAVPCSAQIGVIAGMLAAIGGWLVAAYVAVIFSVLALLGTVLNRFLPGESSALLIDLPPMRLPRIGNVLRKTVNRSRHFLLEAAPWFFIGSLIVSVMQVSGGLNLWQRLLAPLTEGWLRLPGEAATAFVMGLVRRDFGAAGLTELALSPVQIIVALVVITLFVPCIASLMVLFKERGWREASVIWIGSWVVAFTAGGLLVRVIG